MKDGLLLLTPCLNAFSTKEINNRGRSRFPERKRRYSFSAPHVWAGVYASTPHNYEGSRNPSPKGQKAGYSHTRHSEASGSNRAPPPAPSPAERYQAIDIIQRIKQEMRVKLAFQVLQFRLGTLLLQFPLDSRHRYHPSVILIATLRPATKE